MLAAFRLRFDVGYVGNDMPEGRLIIDPFLEDLLHVPVTAWHEFLFREGSHFKEWSNRCRANVLYEGMLKWGKQVEQKYSPHIVYWAMRHDLHLFIVDGRVAVRYKKLNDDLSSNNIPTDLQRKIIEGGLPDLFDQKGIQSVVTIGYQPNDLFTDWRGIYATEWAGEKNLKWYGGLGADFTVDDFVIPSPSDAPRSGGPRNNLRFRKSDNDTSYDGEGKSEDG